MTADQLKPGDHYEWCGHDALVVSIQPKPRKFQRSRHDPGIHVTVEVNGQSRRLHYSRDEAVRLLTAVA